MGLACYGCRSHLREGYLILRSEAEALGARVPVGLEGDLLYEMASYVLSCAGWRRSGRRSSGGLRKTCSGESLAYPVELPFGEVSGVEVREGRLVLAGEVEDLPIG